MELLETVKRGCPYCGETVTLLIDCSLSEQSYVEDCAVCCQPMVINVLIEDESLQVWLDAEGQ